MERISKSQKALLINLIETNLKFINGRFQSAQGAQLTQSVWEQMQKQLNAIGPSKSIVQWKKCWKDLRLGVKTKATKLRQHRTGTGGGKPSKITLSEQEERVMGMVEIEGFDGIPDVPEGGLNLVTPPLKQESPNSTISFGPEDFEMDGHLCPPLTTSFAATHTATSSTIITTSGPFVSRPSTSLFNVTTNAQVSRQSIISSSTPALNSTPIITYNYQFTTINSPTPTEPFTALNTSIVTSLPIATTTQTLTSTPTSIATPIHRSVSIPISLTESTTVATLIQVHSGNVSNSSTRRSPYLASAVDRSMDNQIQTIELLRKIVTTLEANNALLQKIYEGINRT